MTKINIEDLTLGQMREIAALVGGIGTGQPAEPCRPDKTKHDPRPVIVCTDRRGVVFGYCTNTAARPIVLTQARMCLYWSADVGGVFGLGERGPTKDCKVSTVLPELTLEGVTAIFSVDRAAELAWKAAKVQGR